MEWRDREAVGRGGRPIAKDPRLTLPITALLVLALIVGATHGIAVAHVDPLAAQTSVAQMSPDTVAKVSGGGTVLIAAVVASFGVNAKRPSGGASGEAQGRINYNKHANVASRHVNVPVTLMAAETTPAPPNQTGGKATLVGPCGGGGVDECPPTADFVLVYVEDNGDSGANIDVFRIFYCIGTPALPDGFDGTTPPIGCDPPEGDLLRSGNIQIRP